MSTECSHHKQAVAFNNYLYTILEFNNIVLEYIYMYCASMIIILKKKTIIKVY